MLPADLQKNFCKPKVGSLRRLKEVHFFNLSILYLQEKKQFLNFLFGCVLAQKFQSLWGSVSRGGELNLLQKKLLTLKWGLRIDFEKKIFFFPMTKKFSKKNLLDFCYRFSSLMGGAIPYGRG